jgi:hypothetical protein
MTQPRPAKCEQLALALTLATLSGSALAAAQQQQQQCRDVFLQPFASSSIWNTAIGSSAVFRHAHLFDNTTSATCVRHPCGAPFSFRAQIVVLFPLFYPIKPTPVADNDQDFVVRSLVSDPLTPWYNQGAWNGALDMCKITHTNPVTGKPEPGPATLLHFPHDWTSASGGPQHLPNGTSNRSASSPSILPLLVMYGSVFERLRCECRFYSHPGQMNNNAMAVLLPDNRTCELTSNHSLLAIYGSVLSDCLRLQGFRCSPRTVAPRAPHCSVKSHHSAVACEL